ncbi:MAG TPA: hypothetical protein VJ804_08645 [Acidimicrobiales bacterium]|nr:hypothetical protein [Acidimicrobiales bacterium]
MARLANVLRVALALLRRPGLWPAAVGVVVRMGPRPDRAYLRYRGQAVYGAPLSLVPPEDVVRYLEWCRAFPGPIR